MGRKPTTARFRRGIGQRIALLRGGRQMSQVDLAKAVDVNRNTIVAIEGGKAAPGVDTLRKLAKVLGASLDYIVDGKEGE